MIEMLIAFVLVMVILTYVFSVVTNSINSNSKDKTQVTTQKEDISRDKNVQTNNIKDKDKDIQTNTQNTKADVQKQEPKVIIKEVPVTKEVQVVKEVQVPAKNSEGQSFLSSVGSNIIAELVVAVLVSVVTWFIKDYLHLKKKRKLNMNKD